jgi:N-hydroxyarylamine O-acetyltransferase
MPDDPAPSLDLDAYCRRLDASGARQPTLAVLQRLHLAHATHIPFENLDILLGRPIRIDLASIQAKLVHGGRGGYCFEHNTLFAAVLEQIGFRVTRLAARVRLGTARLLPRTHMLLTVEVEGQPWLADVGFGTVGVMLPMPVLAGQEVRQFAWTYRLTEEQGLWVLQSRRGGEWLDLYAFTLEPQHPVDFEVASHYVSTFPTSRLVQTLIVSRSTTEARFMLRNQDFIIDRGDTQSTRVVAEDELVPVLAESFGLVFPAGTRFRSQEERLRVLLQS